MIRGCIAAFKMNERMHRFRIKESSHILLERGTIFSSVNFASIMSICLSPPRDNGISHSMSGQVDFGGHQNDQSSNGYIIFT